MTIFWRCWFGWHAYASWKAIHRQQLMLTEYETGAARAWAEVLDEKRCCRYCGKVQWRRFLTRRI